MKRLILAAVLLCSALLASAADKALPDWQNARVVQRNRYPMTATFETDGQKLSLNGVWKFQWYASIPERSMTFFAADFDDSAWDTMPVPGMWELNGYGDPVYLNVGYAWRGHYENTPPRGEFVLIVSGKDKEEAALEKKLKWESMTIPEHVKMYTDAGMEEKDALRAVAKDRGVSKRDIYNECKR